MPFAAENRVSTDPIEGGIEITLDQYQEALAGIQAGKQVTIQGGFALIDPPLTILAKDAIWRRATDAEAEQMDAALQAQPVRVRRIYEGATYISRNDELYALLADALSQMFGVERAMQLLEPTG